MESTLTAPINLPTFNVDLKKRKITYYSSTGKGITQTQYYYQLTRAVHNVLESCQPFLSADTFAQIMKRD